MNTAIKMPLRSLNPLVVRELQEKYPNAEVNLVLHHNLNHAPFAEQDFWQIISLLDWEKEGDDDAVLQPAVAELAKGPIRHIFEFADMLSEKLYALDGRLFAEQIGEDAWTLDRYFSVDNFLYARCCAIANGEAFNQEVLEHPDKMPKDMTFEALLYLPSAAYQLKTGHKYDYIPTFPIETYSNHAGWE